MDRFLSCDWGTSNFRLRLVNIVTREISFEFKSEEGIAEIYRQWQATGRPEEERIDFYRRKLKDSICRLSADIGGNMPVIISGMASSSIGMMEMPYQEFPFSWDIAQFPIRVIKGDEKFSYPIYLVSGFRTEDDVMRGEESLLLGCDILDEDEKIFIFPGTHSKHVFIKNKMGIDFKTYMTGEIFKLLAEKSILHQSVQEGNDGKSFEEGFQTGIIGNILHGTFLVRTRQLLLHANQVSGYQFLSGLLIGTELGQLKGINCAVYLVCGEHLKQAYLRGLELMDIKKEIICLNADEMLLKSHCKIAGQLLNNNQYEK
ncbi:MAG TPA: 2-dehydro-3-deoxygalactonokinase [Puia sp.]|jgi:2-dehydro-3-deoxygalactonokinase